MKAIRVHEFGGREALQLDEIETPTPGAGEVLVKIAASGVNFIDVYHRTGLYPNKLPLTLGTEAAGTVAKLGAGVSGLSEGDHVAYTGPLGSYAEYAVVPADRLVPVPAGMDLQQAAAAMLQGMTAHYLTHSTYAVQPGDTVLIHAAAGGTGALAVQMAKQRGGTVYGTVSTQEKAQLARDAGADEIIMYTEQDFEAEVKRLTDGKGVNVVYDGVGQQTFEKSLNSLQKRGMMVLFGQSSGAVPPFSPQMLNTKGSLYLTRPTLFHYIASREELLQRASDLFALIAGGDVKLRIDTAYPLAEAAAAHQHLEGRGTTGKLLLIP